jgi:hypothetical protein
LIGKIGPVEVAESEGDYFLTSAAGHYSNVKESGLALRSFIGTTSIIRCGDASYVGSPLVKR